ncbi:MAG: tryptophan--tRNA ligase [Desulfurococcales archaeon]|nr:tryptophan--tRNA ligase [Desulfurococcales archaeon]
MADVRLDPWGHISIEDYSRLFEIFGLSPIAPLIDRIEAIGGPSRLYRRGVVFAHRDLDKFLAELEKGSKVALVTGFMPSGPFHFGHKLVADQVIYFQRMGVKPFIVMADAEAYAVRGIPRKKLIENTRIYIANLIALGVDPDNAVFYMQTNYEPSYYRLIQIASAKVTMAELEAVYGELEPGKVMAAFTQVADILHPMLEDFGRYKAVVVPVGPDQDPHIRLTRDVADRLEGELGLRKPASTYHRLMRGLDGSKKMSSSRPESYISLNDPIDVAVSKLLNSFTGGRATAEEQRRLGGQPEKCMVYEMYLYFLADDDLLKRVFEECRGGKLLCGPDKRVAAKILAEYLEEHQRRFEEALKYVDNYIKIPNY